MPRRRPDVLMLIIDDLRADLGCYGRRFAQTPAMDALSARSTTFLQAHAAVANCAPSRASLLTGLRPDTHGVLDLKTHVRDRHAKLTTLPQRFRLAGYLAVSYGKIFHQFLDDAPSWSSQDEFKDGHTYRGLRGAAWSRAGGWSRGWSYNQYMTPANRAKLAEVSRRRRRGDYRVGINAEMPPYEEGPDADADRRSASAPGAAGTRGEEEYTDERTATRGVRALERLRAQPRPWLLVLGFVRPHLPFNAPARFWARARAAGARGAVGAEAQPQPGLSRLSAAHLNGGDGELYDFAGPRHVRAASAHGRTLATAYAAAVSFVDEQVGRVLGALRRVGGENDTITVLLSDHGWKLGHHGAWGKHTLMAADTHVPLILHAPGYAPKRVHAPVELIDVYPTLCELAGLSWRGGRAWHVARATEAHSAAAAAVATGAHPAAADDGADGDGTEAGDGAGHQRRLGRRRRAHDQPPLEGRSLVPLMRRPAPRMVLRRSAAFSQWPLRKRSLRCMGYAVRTQGWLLVQWAADHEQRPPPAAADEAQSCEAHSDLFKVARNASRLGVLEEQLLPASGGRRTVLARSLRRRLWRVMGRDERA